MQPIHELLARIRHDPDFGSACFEIGYFDRHQGSVHRVALQELTFPEGQGRVFELVDAVGVVRRIPFHRVREVYRDGKLVWNRSL